MLSRHLQTAGVSPLIKAGYKRGLHESDVWGLAQEDRSQTLRRRFSKQWDREQGEENPSLFRALRRAFWRPFVAGGLWKLLDDAAVFVGPIILSRVIRCGPGAWCHHVRVPVCLWYGGQRVEASVRA